MIADLLAENSSVTGVDASKPRLSLCKNIIQKYHTDKTTSGTVVAKSRNDDSAKEQSPTDTKSRVIIRLYCGDGTSFGTTQSASELIFDSTSAIEEQMNRGKRKRMNKSARAREKRRLLKLSSQKSYTCEATSVQNSVPDDKCHEKEKSSTTSIEPFDRVLVDAECSSDGAIRHIHKRQSSSVSKEAAWTDSNMDELVDLQRRLIDSGFRLLKSGGTLVYSTCSLSKRQNEEVVNWLLEKYKDAYIIPVSFGDSSKLEFIQEGGIGGTVRFNPFVSSDTSKLDEDSMLVGGGFFLAKIGKKCL